MPAVKVARISRHDNRRQSLLDAAARAFKEKGFDGATIRDIASAVNMLPGSVYYHFASKEELFVAVHEEGIRRVTESVTEALDGDGSPWERLEAACAAHMRAILDETDYAAVVVRSLPKPNDPTWRRLAELRNRYEHMFRAVINELPLADEIDRKYFRLALLGALNWSQTWYHGDGASPDRIAHEIVKLMKKSGRPETRGAR
jgi:AcrR family transcriptional regulator